MSALETEDKLEIKADGGASLRAFRGRLMFLAFLSVMLTAPFAVPGLWVAVKRFLGFSVSGDIYLQKPQDNQVWYLVFAFLEIGFLLLWTVPGIRWRKCLNVRAGVCAVCYFVPLLLTTLFHGPIFHGVGQCLLPFAFLVAFFVGWHFLGNETGLRKFTWLLLGASALVAFYALLQNRGYEFMPFRELDSASLEQYNPKQRLGSTFGHPNHMASFFLPVFFGGAWLLMTSRRKWTRGFIGAILVLMLLAILIGGARGALAGVLTGMGWYFGLGAGKRRIGWKWPLIFLSVFALLVLLVLIPNPILHARFNLFKRLAGSKELASRFYYWSMAIRMIRDDWAMGIGWGNFDLHFWQYVAAFQKQAGSEWYRYVLTDSIRGIPPGFVHNDFLQVFLEGGVISVAGWIGLWASVYSGILERWRSADSSVRLKLILFASLFTAMGTDALFNFPFHIAVSGGVFWIYAGAWCGFSEQDCEGVAGGKSVGEILPDGE